MSRPRQLNWVEESRQVLFIIMELSWLCSVFFLMDGLTGRWPNLVLFWTPLLYGPAYLAGRLARVRSWTGPRWLALGLSSGVLAVLAAVWVLLPEARPLGAAQSPTAWILGLVRAKDKLYPVLMILIGGGYVLLRGWHLAGRQAEGRDFVAGFQVGFSVLLCCMFLSTWLDPPRWAAAGLIGVFLASALTGLSLARLLKLSAVSPRAQAGPWLLILGATVGLVLAAGLAAWLLADRDLVTLLSRPLVWLWDRFMDLLTWLVSLTKPQPLQDLPQPPPGMPTPEEFLKKARWDYSWMKTAGQIAFFSSSLVLVLGALFGFLKDVMLWLRRKWGDDYLVAVESVEGGFWRDLKTSLVLVWRIFKNWRLRAWAWISPSRYPRSDDEAIRALYRRLLKWGAARGNSKARCQTPFEYLESLRPLGTEKYRHAEIITECYVLVRYGPGPLTSGGLVKAREHWRLLKSRRGRTSAAFDHKEEGKRK